MDEEEKDEEFDNPNKYFDPRNLVFEGAFQYGKVWSESLMK